VTFLHTWHCRQHTICSVCVGCMYANAAVPCMQSLWYSCMFKPEHCQPLWVPLVLQSSFVRISTTCVTGCPRAASFPVLPAVLADAAWTCMRRLMTSMGYTTASAEAPERASNRSICRGPSCSPPVRSPGSRPFFTLTGRNWLSCDIGGTI